MKRQVQALAVITMAASLFAAPASANLVPTTAPFFFTAPTNGTLTFAFEGYSAWDTDQMVFASNGDALFTNQTAAVSTLVQEAVTAGQVYDLTLYDESTGDTWSTNPAANPDGQAHLASTGIFADFGLGTTPPTPVRTGCAAVSGCYLGWEDRPSPGADRDFNDLVVAVQFTPAASRSPDPDPVSEPSTLALLSAVLLSLGFMTYRRV